MDHCNLVVLRWPSPWTVPEGTTGTMITYCHLSINGITNLPFRTSTQTFVSFPTVERRARKDHDLGFMIQILFVSHVYNPGPVVDSDPVQASLQAKCTLTSLHLKQKCAQADLPSFLPSLSQRGADCLDSRARSLSSKEALCPLRQRSHCATVANSHIKQRDGETMSDKYQKTVKRTSGRGKVAQTLRIWAGN